MRIWSFEFRFEFNCQFFGSNRSWGGHRIWERNLRLKVGGDTWNRNLRPKGEETLGLGTGIYAYNK